MKNILILIVILALAVTASAQSKLERNFMSLTDEVLDNLQKFYPVFASGKGIHEYDYLLPDLSSSSIRGEISDLKKFEQRLRKYRNSDLSPEHQIDLKLLKSEVDVAMHDLQKLKWYTINPYMYVNTAMQGIYSIIISHHAPINERAQNINARLKVMPDLFDQAKRNLKKPAPIYTDLALETIPNVISFFESVRDQLSTDLPALSTELAANTAKAIDALRDYRTFLNNIERGESSAFAMGKQDYDYRLAHQYFMNIDSDSLYKIGQNMLAWSDSAYNECLNRLENEESGDSVFVLKCVEKQDMLDYYAWEVRQTKAFLIQHDILTIPDDIGKCVVVETPQFLRNVISSVAYNPPGTFNHDQTGYFYVRPIPDTLDEGQREAYYRYIQRRGFKGAVVHEAYPGHHYEFEMAARLHSRLRKWVENACFYEGWALYCEQMMYDQGFYGNDDRSYLRILGGIKFRAARIMADVKLHARKEPVESVLVWMANQFDGDTTGMRQEINYYCLEPTVPMSYLTGKMEIMALRKALKRAEGDNYTLRGFHDKLMAEGAIPPRLFWEIWGLNRQ